MTEQIYNSYATSVIPTLTERRKKKVLKMDTNARKWCVYAHIHRSSGNVYIGITSQNLQDRFRNGGGYKSSQRFYSAITKYGWDSFKHMVLASNLSEESAKEIERMVIASLKSQNIPLYNLTDGGEGMSGLRLSEEAINKISVALKGKPKSPEHRQRLSEIMTGKYNGSNNPNYGHHLSEEARKRLSDSKRGSNNPNFGTVGKDTSASKRVRQYTLDGKLVSEYPSLSEASRATGIKISGISRCCKKIFSQSNGYIWKFVNNNFKEDKENGIYQQHQENSGR
ncbi:MAG: NUMOD3 domain-containing DNA-binding protein [Endomicrobiaceae bacterium]|nr:NUMOD3 domain-containing DNA-binding protein [Endomicrobiaceae bacterium]